MTTSARLPTSPNRARRSDEPARRRSSGHRRGVHRRRQLRRADCRNRRRPPGCARRTRRPSGGAVGLGLAARTTARGPAERRRVHAASVGVDICTCHACAYHLRGRSSRRVICAYPVYVDRVPTGSMIGLHRIGGRLAARVGVAPRRTGGDTNEFGTTGSGPTVWVGTGRGAIGGGADE